MKKNIFWRKEAMSIDYILRKHSFPMIVTQLLQLQNNHILLFTLQSYLWDNNQAVVQWLTSQLDESDGKILSDSLIGNNIKSVKKDAVINQVQSKINVSLVNMHV